jgi:hypothetical protein
VEHVEQLKRCTCPDTLLRRWEYATTKELEMVRNFSGAVTVLNGDIVNAVCMYDEHLSMTRDGIGAEHPRVV